MNQSWNFFLNIASKSLIELETRLAMAENSSNGTGAEAEFRRSFGGDSSVSGGVRVGT